MSDKELGITVTGDIDDILNKLGTLNDELGNLNDKTLDLTFNVDDTAVKEVVVEFDNLNNQTITPEVNDTAINEAIATTTALGNEMDVIDNETISPNVDTSQLDNLSFTASSTTEELTNTSESADLLNNSLNAIDSTTLNEAASSSSALGDNLSEASNEASNFSNNTKDAADESDNLSNAITGIVGLGLGAWFASTASAAGEYADSWRRLGVAVGEGGASIEAVKDEWSSTISTMQDTTGRSAGTIRTYLTSMSLAGVNSADVLSSAFSGIAGAAFVTGNSVETITSAFKRVVSTGVLGNRQLVSLGLTTGDIYDATGLTVEEVSNKLSTMDSTARTAYLSQIVNSKYATDANNAYKESWEYVIDVLQRSYNYLTILIGGLILPVVVPALESVSWALQQVSGFISNLNGPLKVVAEVVAVGAAAFVTLIGVLGTAKTVMGLLNIEWAFSAVKAELSTVANIANAESYGAAAIEAAAHATAITADTTATDLNTTASNAGIASRIRGIASWISTTASTTANSIAQGVATVTTWALNTAQTALNVTYEFFLALSPVGWLILAAAALAAIITAVWAATDGWKAFTNATTLWESGNQELNEGLNDLKDNVTNAQTAVDQAQERVNNAVPGTQEYTNAVQDLADAKARLEQATTDANEAEQQVQDLNDEHTKAVTDYKNALYDANIALIEYRRVHGLITDEEATSEQQRQQGLKTGKDSITMYNNLTTSLNGTTKSLNESNQRVAEGKQEWWEMIPGVAGVTANLHDYKIKSSEAAVSGNSFSFQLGRVLESAGYLIPGLGSLTLTIQELWHWITGNSPGVIPALQDLQGILSGEWIYSGIESFLGVIKQIYDGLTELVGKAWEFAVQTGENIFNGIMDYVNRLPGEVWDRLMDTLDNILDFAKDAYNYAKEAGKKIQDGIIDSVKNIPGQMYTYGQKILQSLVDGLKDKLGPFEDILNYISDHWPKSPPKIGPLSEVTPQGMSDWVSTIMDAGIDASANFTLGSSIIPASASNVSSTSNKTSIELNVSLEGANINSNLDAAKVGETVGKSAAEEFAGNALNLGVSTIHYQRR